jgi:hypothetical protein
LTGAAGGLCAGAWRGMAGSPERRRQMFYDRFSSVSMDRAGIRVRRET